MHNPRPRVDPRVAEQAAIKARLQEMEAQEEIRQAQMAEKERQRKANMQVT